jgi:hypothetical protein
MITIVTDNLWYGKLLIHLLHEEIYEKRNVKSLKSFVPAAQDDSDGSDAWNIEFSEGEMNLYEGEPGQVAGHVVPQASSYFDR